MFGGKSKEIEMPDGWVVFVDTIEAYRHVVLEDDSGDHKLGVFTISGERHQLVGSEEEIQAAIDKIRAARE